MQLNVELELSQASASEAQNLQARLTAQIEKLRIALSNETVNVENGRNIIVQLRADLELSQAAIAEAKNLQVQQSAEIEKLKLALANETVNMESEYNLKLTLSTERLVK